MHQTLSIEGSTASLPKTQPNPPRFSRADLSTPSPTRLIFSRERNVITPRLTARTRRAASFGETKTFWVTNSSRLEKQKNSGVEISPSSELSFEFHVSKIPTAKTNDAEAKVVLPLFQSLPKQKKVSFSSVIEPPRDPKVSFLNLFRKVQETSNESPPKRDITSNESPLRSTSGFTRFAQSLRSSGSSTARDKDERKSLKQSWSMKLLQLKPVEIIDNVIDIQDLEHKDINTATVSESRNTTITRGQSISNDRILVQPFSVNNIYKQKVQIRKTSLSQLRVELKSIKKLMDTGKVRDNYIPILKMKNREYKSVVQ